MRKLYVAVLLAVALIQSERLSAGPGGCTDFPTLTAIPGGFEQITVSSTSIGFTSSKYAPSGESPADMAIVTIETNAIRYRDDGLAPTASVGQLVSSSTSLTVCGLNSIKTVRFIRVTSDATLDVSYYRGGS